MDFGCKSFRYVNMYIQQAQRSWWAAATGIVHVSVECLFHCLDCCILQLSNLLSKSAPQRAKLNFTSDVSWVRVPATCLCSFLHIDLTPGAYVAKSIGAGLGLAVWWEEGQLSLLHCFSAVLKCCRRTPCAAVSPDPALLRSNLQFGSYSTLR